MLYGGVFLAALVGSFYTMHAADFPVSPSSRDSCVSAAAGSDPCLRVTRLERQVREVGDVSRVLGVRAALRGSGGGSVSESVPAFSTHTEDLAVSVHPPVPLHCWLGATLRKGA